jgi:hypothetical protein
MTRNWKHAVQETVQSNGYIPLPDDVRTVVEMEHPLDGPSVYWNYEQHSNYVVLSQDPLQKRNYVDVGRYTIYDAKGGNGQVRVRPPGRLDDLIRSQFTEGSRVMFLAYEEMAENDNGMVYLLSTGQVLKLLPDASVDGTPTATADGGISLKDALTKLPGFLPAPQRT